MHLPALMNGTSFGLGRWLMVTDSALYCRATAQPLS